MLDQKATNYQVIREITMLDVANINYNSAIKITLYYNSITTGLIAQNPYWAIVDENYNVLFASNEKLSGVLNTQSVNIYFYPRINRLN